MKALFAFNTDVPWSRVIADQRRWLVPVVAILAINIAVLFAVVLPMRRSVETGTEQAAASAQALGAAIAELKDAEATRDGQVDASKDLDRFYGEVLPANFAAARRMTQLKLAQMAQAQDVRYQSGAATPEVLRDSTLERLRVDCSLEGDWDDIRQLIYDIETGPDFMVIDNVSLAEGESATAPLSLRLRISTYYRVAGNVR
jgi:Tfp pilus assembly protein PilO